MLGRISLVKVSRPGLLFLKGLITVWIPWLVTGLTQSRAMAPMLFPLPELPLAFFEGGHFPTLLASVRGVPSAQAVTACASGTAGGFPLPLSLLLLASPLGAPGPQTPPLDPSSPGVRAPPPRPGGKAWVMSSPTAYGGVSLKYTTATRAGRQKSQAPPWLEGPLPPLLPASLWVPLQLGFWTHAFCLSGCRWALWGCGIICHGQRAGIMGTTSAVSSVLLPLLFQSIHP